jgi:hypothetical protein
VFVALFRESGGVSVSIRRSRRTIGANRSLYGGHMFTGA